MTNARGEQTDIIISLKNDKVKEYFQDLLDAISAMERDDDDETIPFETVKKRVLSNQKSRVTI
ncbi:MAG: hypothetical protein MUE30_15200, partial [Spirosomaceae bacterium]|nr:hypothetical protein [Spirosomataceae bacterium]